MRIGIIGAGHAGIEAAMAARNAGAEVALFSAEPVLPYFRPRLVGVAMGITAPEAIAFHPAAWYQDRGIDLHMGAPVTALDVAARTVIANGGTERFDAMVLACGATPRMAPVCCTTPGSPIFTLWSMADALQIRQRVRPGARLVMIGGSSLGVESALTACGQQVQVTIVEGLPRLFPQLLGSGAAVFLRQQLESRAIVVRTGHAVASLAPHGDGVRVELAGGAICEAELAMICIGARSNLELAQQAGLATAQGVCTDDCLQAAEGVFVAGDVCQAAGRLPRGAVREAMAQGRMAGANAVAFATGGQLQAFVPMQSPMTLRAAGVEIVAIGQASGLVEERLPDGAAGTYRAVTRHTDGSLAGVQMIGTREGFDELAAQIGGLRVCRT